MLFYLDTPAFKRVIFLKTGCSMRFYPHG